MRSATLAAALLVFSLSACSPDLTVPNNNAGSVNLLSSGASPTAIATATLGIFDLSRNLVQQFYVAIAGEVGREGYCMDPTNPDCVTHPLIEGPDPGRFEVTSLYNPPYLAIRMANVVLDGVPNATGLTAQQQEGVLGAALTMKALNFLYLIGVFDQSGLPIDVDRPPGADLPPVVAKDSVYRYIVQLLDQGQTHLQNAGSTFLFKLPSGFAGFNTPATFVRFNRALRARVDVYMGNYATALTSLGSSFIDTSAATLAGLNVGVYHNFSTSSGDLSLSQDMYDPTSRIIMAHPALLTDAQLRADLTRDLRYQRKVTKVAARTLSGVTDSLGFTIYTAPGAPVPIIRNEELILLRAEANLGCVAGGTNLAPTITCTGNANAALQDINFVRRVSGGLDSITTAAWTGKTPDQQLEALLYEKRYSLLWEGAHRWIDTRRYNKLLDLPKYASNHVIYPYWPLAQAECVVRSPQPPGCATPTPF